MTFIDRPGMSQVKSATPSESISKRKFVRFIGISLVDGSFVVGGPKLKA
jgi:hypothetical protein